MGSEASQLVENVGYINDLYGNARTFVVLLSAVLDAFIYHMDLHLLVKNFTKATCKSFFVCLSSCNIFPPK